MTRHDHRLIKALGVLVVLCLLTACPRDRGHGPPPPGHSGQVPSGAAQQVANSLYNAVLTDRAGDLGGGDWVVGPFGVVPNPRTGKGPVISLSQGSTEVYVPLETDADVADLHRRVHGKMPAGLTGKMSDAYREVWGGRTSR